MQVHTHTHTHMHTTVAQNSVQARWSDDAHGLSYMDGHVQPQDVAAPFRHLISLKIITPSGKELGSAKYEEDAGTQHVTRVVRKSTVTSY